MDGDWQIQRTIDCWPYCYTCSNMFSWDYWYDVSVTKEQTLILMVIIAYENKVSNVHCVFSSRQPDQCRRIEKILFRLNVVLFALLLCALNILLHVRTHGVKEQLRGAILNLLRRRRPIYLLPPHSLASPTLSIWKVFSRTPFYHEWTVDLYAYINRIRKIPFSSNHFNSSSCIHFFVFCLICYSA